MRDYLHFWLNDAGRRRQYLALLALLWLCAFSVQWFGISKDVAGARRTLGISAETVYLPPVPVLRMASLGNQSFAADLLFVRAAHYFVRHLTTDSRLPWIDLYLQGIWGLDAHNRSNYRWGSQVIKFGQQIDADVARRANQFARLGLAHFPEDPWLYHEIAYNLRYTIESRDAQEAAHLKDLALQYLEIAYSFPGFQYDPNYLASQYSRAGREEDAVRTVLTTYDSASEDQRRELRLLLEERDKPQVAAELAWYDAVRGRDWPYVPATLALFLGPKRVPAPPLDPTQPQSWHGEPPLSAAMRKRLGLDRLLPPPDQRPHADEDVDLALAASPTESRPKKAKLAPGP